MYEDKKVMGINYDYFLEHAEEIINDTVHILNPFPMEFLGCLSEKDHKKHDEIYLYYQRLKETHQEMWMMFGRGNWFMKPGETDEAEALNRVNHEYCEATGRWDLYVWGTGEDIEKRRMETIKEWKKRKIKKRGKLIEW